jgi:outer membrane protein assembly factor BamD
MKRIFLFLFISIFIFSCSNKYQKTLKGNDANKKLELAQYYYNKKDYFRANNLFEQLQNTYTGTAMAEKVMYYSAYCNYGLQNYILAGYQFKTYYENFPTGSWAEESLYMHAYCLYLESQHYYLDQTDTYKGLDALKLFINVYPESKYVSECNVLMDKLRGKLSYKAYRTAKLYHNIGEYKSAIVALQNAIRDFPEIPQKEELDYLTVKSHYLLADNSIDDKKESRYQDAILAYQQFNGEYPDSKYQNELKKMQYKSEGSLKKIQAKNASKKEKDQSKTSF